MEHHAMKNTLGMFELYILLAVEGLERATVTQIVASIDGARRVTTKRPERSNVHSTLNRLTEKGLVRSSRGKEARQGKNGRRMYCDVMKWSVTAKAIRLLEYTREEIEALDKYAFNHQPEF
jgi:predicted transcriptional regulator